MTEIEANSIAEAIRGAALKAVHVESSRTRPKDIKIPGEMPLSRPNIQTQRTAYPQRDASLDQKTL